jgi:5'-3' exoribonuclease 2
MGYNNYNRNP